MKFNKYILAIVSSAVIISSCTSRFEELNTNSTGFTNEQLEQDFNHVRGLFGPMINNVYTYDPAWQTQLQQNLIGDVYSGYMMPPTPFASNINNMNYALVDGWNNFPWSIAYTQVMSNALRVKQRAETEYPQFYAWSLIIKVEAMHRLTDIYGPIVYSAFGTEDALIPYDSQEAVYMKFFEELDIAVDELTTRVNNGETSAFGDTDFTLYSGNYSQWVKFANSLRLRLAVRISKVNPGLAKTEAEKAVSHPIGVMTSNTDNAVVNSASFSHPLITINSGWNDIRMGAPMESILVGYEDPRVSTYFEPSEVVAGEYKGIRNGIDIAAKADYVTFSPLGEVINTNQITWMTAAEVYFLRAEGVLRGWDMQGTASDLYESGVRTSFAQHGAANVDTYLADDTKVPAPYVDPNNATNNVDADSPYLGTATVMWDDALDNEAKLEKIITQKWIAMFPDGQEAWSEFRRTGYPKLFPVVINNSGGLISTEEFIRRINFVRSEYDGNPEGVQTGVNHLNGPDNGGTRLWWDTGNANF